MCTMIKCKRKWIITSFLITLLHSARLQYPMMGIGMGPMYPMPPPMYPPIQVAVMPAAVVINDRAKTTTTPKPVGSYDRNDGRIQFSIPMPLPYDVTKYKKQLENGYAVPLPPIPPPPIVVVPYGNNQRRTNRRPGQHYPDSCEPPCKSESNACSDESDSCEYRKRSRRRKRPRKIARTRNIKRKRKPMKGHTSRRDFATIEMESSDNELVNPVLSYVSRNGKVKFNKKISRQDADQLLNGGDRPEEEENVQTVQVLTGTGGDEKQQILVLSGNKKGLLNFRRKQVMLRNGKSHHVLDEGKKQIVFKAPDEKKISNISVSFQVIP